MSVNVKMTSIADAIRAKTGGTEALTLDQMAQEIAGIQTGGGGSLESGELTLTSANYYGFTIPVSSRKSHVVIYPKSIADAVGGAHNTGRVSAVFVADGNGQMYARITAGGITDSTGSVTEFNENSIKFTNTLGGAPYNTGEYYWYAW